MKPEHPRLSYRRLVSQRAFLLAPQRSYSLARACLLSSHPSVSLPLRCLIAVSLSVLISSTVTSPDSAFSSSAAWAQASPTDEAFDPSEEALKGEGLIGPPVFNQSDSGCAHNGIDSLSPHSVPAWSHPASRQFHEPLSNSRSCWNPIQSTSSSPAPQAVYQQGSNDDAWNLWLNMADHRKQPASQFPEYGAAARIAGFGRGVNTRPGQDSAGVTRPVSGQEQYAGAPAEKPGQFVGTPGQLSSSPPGDNADFVPVPPPQHVAAGQWALPSNGWGSTSAQASASPLQEAQANPSWIQPMPTQAGRWVPVPQAAWQAPIAQGVQQVPSNNSPGNQTPSFNLGASATPTAQPPQGDVFGGFMTWLGQMPNPFNQGQTAQAGLQQAASSFRLPDMTPTDPNNPLSSPMASMVAGAIGSWVTQQVRANNPFQLGSSPSKSILQPSIPSPSSLPSLFPTELKMEAKGVSNSPSEEQSILDSQLADSLLSPNQFPKGSNSSSQRFSSRPTSFRGPLGIPIPGLLGNALASQRNKFAVNYLLNRSLRGSGFGIRLR